jgi:hypothetical protein
MQTLGGEIGAIVHNGAEWRNRYGVKFRARKAVILAAVNNGWSMQDCELVLLDPTAAVSELWLKGEDDRALGSTQAYKRLSKDYKAAWAYAGDNPAWSSAAEVRQHLGELIAMADTRPWLGRTGRTDKAVMMAALRIASEVGTTEPDLSCRDVSLRAGVTKDTAARALRRLCRQGWLKPRWASQPEGHSRRFTIAQAFDNQTHSSLGGSTGYVSDYETPYVTGKSTNASHEVWTRLGKAALEVWRALGGEPVSAREVAKRASVANSTASRQLPRLASYRLSARYGNGWISGPATPDDVVKDMGWIAYNSKVEQRRTKYEEDREIYKWWLTKADVVKMA